MKRKKKEKAKVVDIGEYQGTFAFDPQREG